MVIYVVLYYILILALVVLAFSLVIISYAIYNSEYPPEVLIAVKQYDNNTVLIYSDYQMIYNGHQGYMLKLNGTYYNIISKLTDIKFKINGKTGIVTDVKPALEDAWGLTGLTQLGNPDMVYKVSVKYK